MRVIRPFVYVREKDLRQFAAEVSTTKFTILVIILVQAQLPIIPENCPACFEAPKVSFLISEILDYSVHCLQERHRVKQLLAAQEVLFPRLFTSLQAALRPLMAFDTHNTTIRYLLSNDTSNGLDEQYQI